MPANIVVPEMGESIVDARIARWLKKEGEPVTVGEALVELETDKVDVEVSASQNGVLERIARDAGADVKIGEVLGVIGDAAAGIGERPRPPRPRPRSKGRMVRRVAATPSARKAAREQNVEIVERQERGAARHEGGRRQNRRPAGSTSPAAVASSAPPVEPAPAAKPVATPADAGARVEERIRMSKRRATIARRLVEAQQTAAMLTTFNEVDMSTVMALRERHKEAFKTRHGVGLGIASFFVKAAVAALREFPNLNAEIQGDEMVLKHYYDIGVAVGAAEGLVVPVLRAADRMAFAEIEHGIRDFAARANEGHPDARRSARRHVQHHERRRVRLAHEHADSQSAAGRHPRPPRDQGSSHRCRGRQVVDAADDVHRAHLRSPDRGRVRSRAVSRARQGDGRGSGRAGDRFLTVDFPSGPARAPPPVKTC